MYHEAMTPGTMSKEGAEAAKAALEKPFTLEKRPTSIEVKTFAKAMLKLALTAQSNK